VRRAPWAEGRASCLHVAVPPIVPGEGLEPSQPKPADFESAASASSATRAWRITLHCAAMTASGTGPGRIAAWRTKRRIAEITRRISRVRDEIGVLDAQLVVLADDTEDARVRSLVSENPVDRTDADELRRQLQSLQVVRDDAAVQVDRLVAERDELLERLV
jgi:hypothetical protein